MEAVIAVCAVCIAAWVLSRIAFTKIVIREYERGLLYRNGRFIRELHPGGHWIAKARSSVARADLRARTMTIQGQEVLSADHVGLKASAAVAFKIADSAKAAHAVEDHAAALYVAAQLAIRSTVGAIKIDDLLAGRMEIGKRLLDRVAPEAEKMGLSVQSVEIKDVMLPGELKKIFAETVKARKEGEAALERARGETAALRSLANAAQMMERSPALANLKVLQAVASASTTPGTTLVLGVGNGIVPLGVGKS